MTQQRTKEYLYSSFIEQVKGYAIFATDANGYITAWNKGAERLKGYTEEEILGQYYGILHPDPYQEAGRPEEELKIAVRDGVFENDDWRKKKDGSLFWASVTLSPIYAEDQSLIGFTKVTGDISRQKELEEKLAERQQHALEDKNIELRKINTDLDNFIYTASHDLRSPITNIEGLMILLKDELVASESLTPDTEEVLQRVVDSVNRFKKTIEDLTEISRLHKNYGESPSEEVLNIQKVYEDIVADLGYAAKLSPCIIHTDFEVYTLQFSSKYFRSILFNLISNAIKYQSPARPCSIHLTTRLEEPYVILGVKDNGLGLDDRHQKQLFTMFKRFHDHVEGSGIGLYMVKRIMDNAGGKIEVKSEKGVGTEILVYFKASM